ncbi:hypothetical protein, partial [Enterococcus faecalis]|uniref:hypothetical protein n=1 Tax=Enterococcus faecalis TaxID=1351 RepID=UPI003D6C4EF3
INLSLIFIEALSSAEHAVYFYIGFLWLDFTIKRRLFIGGSFLGILFGGSFFRNHLTSSKVIQLSITGIYEANTDILFIMF